MRPASHPTWGLIILMGSLSAMGPIAIDMYLPSLPAMGASLHATSSQTEATVAAFLAGMAFGQLIYGPASDRHGRRLPVLFGVLLFILASGLCAMATSPQILIAARLVQAAGACAGGVVARAVIRDRFDHAETARMLSMMALIVGIAPVLAPLLGGLWLQLGGWRLNFWVMAGFGILVGVITFLIMEETLGDEAKTHARQENPASSYFALLKQRRILGYVLAGGLNGATLFTYISTAPNLLIKVYHVPAAEFGWVFGINAAGLVVGGQINRLLLRRSVPDRVLSRASLVAVGIGACLALAAFAGAGGPWTILPLLFLIVGTYAFMQGNTMAGALNVDPRRAGATSALMGFASFGVGALVSGITALFEDGTARPMATAMFLALAGSSLTLHSLALPKRPSPHSVDAAGAR